MKSPRIWLLATALSLVLSAPASASAEDRVVPTVSAQAAVLMDADSGRVLWAVNGEEPRLIASTTKIMTALLALEGLDPDRTVAADPAWTGIEGSTMYLRPGQVLTVRELLYGLMLASGNDAAVAVACLTAGSTEAFADMMNARAAELGCDHTHFENPSGLDGQTHHASAHDLARIAREAMKNRDFREIVSTVSATVGDLTYTNHNRLLGRCEGVCGVKTGYTEAAGRTLVSFCERNGIPLICVTLADPDDWRDHAALYDWAYGTYYMQTPDLSGLPSVPVIGGDREEIPVRPAGPARVLAGPGEKIRVSLRLPAFVYAEVRQGQPAGQAILQVDGVTVGEVPLVYGADAALRSEETPAAGRRLLDRIGMGERSIYTLS